MCFPRHLHGSENLRSLSVISFMYLEDVATPHHTLHGIGLLQEDWVVGRQNCSHLRLWDGVSHRAIASGHIR